MIVNTILVEDDPTHLKLLQMQLWSSCPAVRICGSAKSLAEAETLIYLHQPELLICDIALLDGTVFDVLTRFAGYDGMLPFETIFITADEEAHRDALRFRPVAYLTKPYAPEDLIRAVEHAQQAISIKRHALLYLTMTGTGTGLPQPPTTSRAAVIGVSASGTSALPFLDIRHSETEPPFHLLPEDIIAVRAAGACSWVLYVGAQGQIAESRDKRRLGDWEELLLGQPKADTTDTTDTTDATDATDTTTIMRIHHSTIVNLLHVVSWEHHNKKDATAILHSGHRLPVSRLRKKDFRERWVRVRQRVLLSPYLLPPAGGAAGTRPNDETEQ